MVDGVRHQFGDHHGGVLGQVVADAPVVRRGAQERARPGGRRGVGGQAQLAGPGVTRPAAEGRPAGRLGGV